MGAPDVRSSGQVGGPVPTRLKIFGPDGDLSKKSNDLIKPIQDRVAKAVQAVAESENLDMVFDKNSEVMMLYANPRYDKSAAVITRLGLKPGVLAK